jgi:hypothetical protein
MDSSILSTIRVIVALLRSESLALKALKRRYPYSFFLHFHHFRRDFLQLPDFYPFTTGFFSISHSSALESFGLRSNEKWTHLRSLPIYGPYQIMIIGD